MNLKKIIIVLPLFNDWKSASKLLTELNINFSNYKFIVEILIINDCSSEKNKNYFKKLANINKIEILSLKRNLGSQRAIYIGLKRIKKKTNSIIVVMDSDGEDDVSKVKNLVQKVQSNDDGIVFAKRTKRQEPFLLRFLNQIRLVLTFMFTGKYMDVGNFCAFDSKHLKSLLRNKNICIAFCSGAIKNLKSIFYYGVKKKKRYFGSSKVNFFFLIKHSLNIITVFYREVFFITSIVFFITYILEKYSENFFLFFSIYLLINLVFISNYFLKINQSFEKEIIKSMKKIK